jgi:tetratricopeptide (TPR) repeat protein
MHLLRPSATRRLTWYVPLVLLLAVTGSASAQTPPPSLDTASARAEALLTAGDYAGAVRAFEALTRARPQQPRYWVRFGVSLQKVGRTDDAIAAYRQAISITVAPVAMYNLATIYATRGQKDSAFHWLDETVKAGFASEATITGDADLASLRGDARYAGIVERVHNALRPCLTRKESRTFDFWAGEWDVKTPQGQPAGSSSVQLLLEGCALYENWTDAQGGGGKSLNSYNPDTKMWQQFWTDQYGRVTEYRESEWVNGSLRFSAHQVMPQGPALLHMTFTPVKPDLVRQFGEMSLDGGKTWSPTFDLFYHRKAK